MIERRLVSRPVSTIGTLIAPRVTQQEGPPIITEGLVLHLDAGSPYSYPSSGTAWTDLSGNANTGTLQNGVSHTSSNQGTLTFDGTDDYVSFASSSNLLFLNRDPFSLEAWIKVAVAPPTSGVGQLPGVIVRDGNVGLGREGWEIGLARSNTTTVRIAFRRLVAGSQQVAQFTTNPTDIVSKWWHIVGTYDGTTLRNYIDGVLSGSATSTGNITDSTTPLEIGRLYDSHPFNGNIAISRIYSRALTATEVAQNFQALRGRYGI